MKTRFKVMIVSLSALTALLLAGVAAPLTVYGIRSARLHDDYSSLAEEYKTKVEITDLGLIKQEISCGYACIEMVSSYYGNKITEAELSEKNNGAITTSSTNGFLVEISKTLPNKTFVKNTYLKDSAFLKEIHISLSKRNPVVIEWAAKYENEWTLHYSVVTSIDIGNDLIKVNNPYGYIEELKIKEFLDRTSFDAYKGMPFFLTFGFAYNAFHKNALIHVKNA